MKHCIVLLLLVLFSCQSSDKSPATYNIESVASAEGTEVFQDNWDNIRENYKFPEWFQDAKFGIFIHWGIYSIPAFGTEWYARHMYMQNSNEYKYHVEKYGDPLTFGYKDFIPMFTAEKFNADEWVELFKESGAKYIVPVAEHHDGFAMYDSKVNSWNSVNMGPKKDIVGLLQKAADKRGLIFGLSTHRAENAWFYGGGMKFPSDVQDSTITLYGERLERNQVNTRFMNNFMTHTYELIDKYHPRLIWFDWTVNSQQIMPYFNKIMAHYYNTAIDWGKEVVVNTKYGYPKDVMVWDVERGKSDALKRYPWQTDTSVGKKSWSYVVDEENKTPEQIVQDLVDIVSKNGNLLLNVGPRADGSITEEQQSVLRGIGEWLKINGEAIYGARTWVRYGEGVIKGASGAFTDSHATSYTAGDIRFTTHGNILYATSLGWTDGKILISSLDASKTKNMEIKNVSLLGSNEKIDWNYTDKGLEIQFPKNKPCEYAYSFKIELNGLAIGDASYTITPDNNLEISDYIYNHSNKPQTVALQIKNGNKVVKEEPFIIEPSVRNEYIHVLTEVSNGLCDISMQIEGLRTSAYTGLFPALNFEDNWKFHRGDDMAWTKPDVDESEWEPTAKLPQNWETHSGYDAPRVFGWYRKTINIPEEWRHLKLILPVGSIDDAGEVYLNGICIGKSGSLPPNFISSENVPIEVELPEHAIQYGKDNILSIRIFDDRGDGGIVRGPLGPLKVGK